MADKERVVTVNIAEKLQNSLINIIWYMWLGLETNDSILFQLQEINEDNKILQKITVLNSESDVELDCVQLELDTTINITIKVIVENEKVIMLES